MALVIKLQVKDDGTVVLDKVAKKVNEVDDAHKGLGKTMGSMKGIVTALASGFIAYKAIDIAKSILDTNVQMRNYHTTLNTIIGSQQEANKHFEWLKDFAATTPFQFPELVDASVKLQAYGLDAEKYMTILGDTAASMGKDLNSAVEMLADASNGEFERMKEFGLRATDVAAAAGFKTVKDMTSTRDNLAQGTEALMSILEDRYKGGMKNLSMELGGMISNMQDYWTEFQTDVGDQGAYNYARAGMATVLDMLHEWSEDGTLEEWAKTTSDVMVWLFEEIATGFTYAKMGGYSFYAIWESLKVVWWQAAGVWQSLVSAFYATAKGANEILGRNESVAKYNKMLLQSELTYAKFGQYAAEAHVAVADAAEAIRNAPKDLEDFLAKVDKRKAEFDAADKSAKNTRIKQTKELNTELEDNAKKLKEQADAVTWVEENITDKFLKGVDARRDAVDDEYKGRTAHLDELLKKEAITQAEYNTQIIANKKLYAQELAELEQEIAEDRAGAQAWAQENIYANMENSLLAQIQLEEKANKDRLKSLKDYVDDGLLTEQEADQYAVDSEKLKNEKIKKLRYDDLKNAEKKRDDEIAMQKFELQQKVKNASSFYEYMRLKYDSDTKDFRTAQEKQLDDWEKYYDQVKDMTDDFSQASKEMISDMLFDGVKGDMDSFKTYWDSFWDSMLKSVTDTVANMVVEAGTETVVDYFMSMLSSYAVGSYEISEDQLALIHAGEMIIPAGEAQTFRESLEANTGMSSLAETNPTAYSTFTNTAMSNFATGATKHAAVSIAGGLQYGASPADIMSAITNPVAWSANAVFSAWEGAEAALEQGMGIEGTEVSEKVGNFAGALAMATGVTPAGFLGALASKAISTVVDMAVGAVQVAVASKYAEQMAEQNQISAVFNAFADALNARPYEGFLDQIEVESPDLSIAATYAEAQKRSQKLYQSYSKWFDVISAGSLADDYADMDSWATNAAEALGYGKGVSVSSNGITSSGNGSFSSNYSDIDSWSHDAMESLGYDTDPFGGTGFGFGGESDDESGYSGDSDSDSDSDSGGSRFHTGGYLGLKNDEGFFIGQEGEGVVSKPGMEVLEAINSGKVSGSGRDMRQVEQLLTQILLKLTEQTQTQNEWSENGLPTVAVS